MKGHKARPTVYKGVQYRSRLEATWAAFFDLAGVKALYEFREDLDGYIPDFEVVLPKGYYCGRTVGPRVLAEVKPAFTQEDFYPAVEKLYASGHWGEAMLLGADPECCWWLSTDQWRPLSWAAFGVTDYCKHETGPRPRPTPGRYAGLGVGAGSTVWARAQNATQWNAPAPGAPPGRYAGLSGGRRR